MKNILGLLVVTILYAVMSLPLEAGRQGRIDLKTLEVASYTVDGDAFIGHNLDRCYNRSLYCSHIYAAVLAGDKPYAQVGIQMHMLGDFMFALVRNGKGTWLQNASDITSTYRPGRMEWKVGDASWGKTKVVVEVVPTESGPGMAARIHLEDGLPGDQVTWASGSAFFIAGNKGGGANILWAYDMISQKPVHLHDGFMPDKCKGNKIVLNADHSWSIQSQETDAPTAVGECSDAAQEKIVDAQQFTDPVALLASTGGDEPLVCGSSEIAKDSYLYLSLAGSPSETGKTAQNNFEAGMKREKDLEARITVDTPDPWLNAGVGACQNVQDACYRDGFYAHSGMRWATPLIGWRTLFAGTVFGAHDSVKSDAKIAIATQITDSNFKEPKADETTGLTSQAPESRMFGIGRIDIDDPHHYDMQSQFFDQIEHAWRWTGDPELEKLLTPSLDLHCQYIKDCFDPAGLGIYESYANTWPTDDQWYNGDGTSEETAYAYTAESTALALAKRAGDKPAIARHQANVDHIRDAFFKLLWVADKGYPGASREQSGLKRLKESCWLYAIFCPVDAGLLDSEQSAQAVYYSEWALERMKMPYGGEECWPSNWVPSIWSVREMWSGDDYQLALAYCQAGLPDDGWKVFRGMFPQQELFGMVPGDMGHPAGGTDFNDCNSMFARTVVEGMFGYVPNYPAGVVKIAPQFPSDWDHASIKTPDMSIAYHRQGVKSNCDVTLTQPCALDIQLPVSTSAVTSVTVDGAPVEWKVLPGFQRSIVDVQLSSRAAAKIEVTCQDALKVLPATVLEGNSGQAMELKSENGEITDFHDPQGALANAKIQAGSIQGQLTNNAGYHEVFGLTKVGSTTQWRIFKIHITDVDADTKMANKTEIAVPDKANWSQVDLQPVLNGDIRTIYKQKYVSPRPNTCSLRLAIDGYSSWQNYRPTSAPIIDMSQAASLTDASGHLIAGKGIPFQMGPGDKNIAFTSTWDNWPHEVNVPVNKSGDAIWFLICGTTNPMEVRIANAELHMVYTDGVEEKLEIVPPFNFWTLCPFGPDYDYVRDGFSLPKVPPTTVQLGHNCRGIVLGWRLRPGVPLKSVKLETLSQEVTIGLMAATVMNPK